VDMAKMPHIPTKIWGKEREIMRMKVLDRLKRSKHDAFHLLWKDVSHSFCFIMVPYV
jgi:hypothetical protein